MERLDLKPQKLSMMSFVKTLKKALGFSDSEMEEEELEGIDARVTPLRSRGENAAAISREEQLTTSQSDHDEAEIGSDNEPSDAVSNGDGSSVSGDAVTPDAIFESVVRIFNEALPDFLHSTVDEKSQREYLYRALDSSMKSYLDSLSERAGRDCSQRFENERRSMQMEMEELRRKVQKEETDSSESKKLQLSAERQKRALNERLHEFEKQLATLQAENEQYVLENKSLMNKLRVSALTSGNGDTSSDGQTAERMEELAHGLEAAQEELAVQKELTAKAQQEAKENLMALDMNRRKLASSMEEWQAESAEKDEQLASSRAQADRLALEVEKLRAALEQAKVKDEFGGAMINELQSKAAEARDEAADARQQLESLQAEVASLRAGNARLEAERASLSERLDEANESLRVVEEMHLQLDKLEEARKHNESVQRCQKDEILALTEQLKRQELEKAEYSEAMAAKENSIRNLEEQTDSLRKTIENNLYEHARSESVLRAEIDRLKSLAGRTPEKAQTYPSDAGTLSFAEEPSMSDGETLEVLLPASKEEGRNGASADPAEGKRKGGKRGRKPKVRISAIDDTIEDTDWLVATPPAGKKAQAARQDNSNEFGYKEPDRKITPDHPAQMSLW